MNKIDIKLLRKAMGVSQERFAEMLGVHLRTIQNWETGGVIPVSKHALLHKIASEFSNDRVYGVGSNNVLAEGVVEYKTTKRSAEYWRDRYMEVLEENRRLHNELMGLSTDEGV